MENMTESNNKVDCEENETSLLRPKLTTMNVAQKHVHLDLAKKQRCISEGQYDPCKVSTYRGERKVSEYDLKTEIILKESVQESSPLLGRDCHDNKMITDKSKVENTENVGRILGFRKLPRRKQCVLVLCTLTYFLEGCGFSLLAPFFPKEAQNKGMSLTLTGFVFSVFELMIFITSPLFGSFLTKLGPKFIVLSGIFTAGTCSVLFGTLASCPPGTPFIVISILCRSVEAVGFSAYVTALMAIVSSEFPKDITTTFSILETASGIGTMVGPALGGALHELGGFGLPFYVIGGLILINGIFVYFIIPRPERIPEKTSSKSRLSILRSPMVVIAMLSICVGCLCAAFLDPTLANRLKPFNLSVSVIGLFFLISPCTYTIFSPLWGFLTERKGVNRQLIVIGHFVYGAAFFFIGPSNIVLPFLPSGLWSVAVGLLVEGAFFGCCLIPNLKCMIQGAADVGFEENIKTYAVVSGLLNSMYSFGSFLGPMVGGVLVEQLGNSMAFTAVGLLSIATSFVTLIFFTTDHFKRKRLIHEDLG